MFKLGIGNGYTRSDMLLELKGQGHRVSKSILHTRTAIHRHSLGGVTSRRRGIELYECLLRSYPQAYHPKHTTNIHTQLFQFVFNA